MRKGEWGEEGEGRRWERKRDFIKFLELGISISFRVWGELKGKHTGLCFFYVLSLDQIGSGFYKGYFINPGVHEERG